MFGVGATVGTGIFFVLQRGRARRRPGGDLLVPARRRRRRSVGALLRRAGQRDPGLGSTYSYAYARWASSSRWCIAACLLLEYGVSTAAVAVGLERLPQRAAGQPLRCPAAGRAVVLAVPTRTATGLINLPAVVLVAAVHAAADPREPASRRKVNAIMVLIKLTVLVLFIVIGFTAFNADHFADFAPFGVAGHQRRGRHDLLLLHRPGRRVHGGRGGARTRRGRCRGRSWARSDRRHASTCWWPSRRRRAAGEEFEGRAGGRPVADPGEHHRHRRGRARSSPPGAVISIFSVTLVTLYGQTRILFAMGRDGMLPTTFASGEPAHAHAGSTRSWSRSWSRDRAASCRPTTCWDTVSIGTLVAFIVVAIGVIVLRRTAPDLPRPFKVPGYPVTPVLTVPPASTSCPGSRRSPG